MPTKAMALTRAIASAAPAGTQVATSARAAARIVDSARRAVKTGVQTGRYKQGVSEKHVDKLHGHGTEQGGG